MSLWDWLAGEIKSVAKPPTELVVPTANVSPGSQSGVVFVAEQHYLRIWLKEMMLRDGKKWFTDRYPNVHSLVSLQYGDKTVELANIAGQSKLNIGTFSLNQSRLVNYSLTGLLPFRGGTVQLDCGLMSLQSNNLMESFAQVVGDFASMLTQPQVSAAIGIAKSVAGGVQGLLGAGKAEPALYYHTEFTATGGGSPLVSGYIFLSDHQAGSINLNSLWISGEHILVGATAASAVPIQGHDYMVFQIECVTERDDWRQLTTIADPFSTALDAKMAGEADKAKQLLGQALITANKSPDLTLLDRKRVIDALRKAYNETTGVDAGLVGGALDAAIGGAAGEELSPIEKAMLNALDPKQAGALPDFTDAQLLKALAAT